MEHKAATRLAWARWGDLNAFCGLILDNVAVMIVLVVLITSAHPAADGCFSREFVLTQMIPGTALGVVIGDLVYTWMAIRLARRTGRTDVTAMPLGLDTPSTFAVAGLLLLPALKEGMIAYGLNHDQAMVFAWHVGAVVLLLVGVFKSILAPFVGLAALTIILVTLVAHRVLPGRIPGALAAVLVGAMLYFAGQSLAQSFGWPLAPPAQPYAASVWRAPDLLPEFARNLAWWRHVVWHAVAAEKPS